MSINLMKLVSLMICAFGLSLLYAEPPHTAEVAEPVEVKVSTAIQEGTKLQIFLDQKQFGPGVIDGRPGTFTKLAIKNYNSSLGRDVGDQAVRKEASESITQPYIRAIVPADVEKYVNAELPTERELQVESSYMSYRGVLEFMSERYHASEGLLIELNGKKAVYSAKAGSQLIVPNVSPFKIEDLKHGKSYHKEENLTARHILIDTDVKQAYIYQLNLPSEDDASQKSTRELVASFPITPGKSQFIPKGFWNLKNSIELPTWRYDKLLLETGVRGEESLNIPQGPNNPVGVIWNGLSKSGIGIHGTNSPNTIGRARSAGCIRMTNWDAARIPGLVRPGAIVEIK